MCERMGKLSLGSCESCQGYACLLFLYNHLLLSVGELSIELKRGGVPGSFCFINLLRRENSLDGRRVGEDGKSQWVRSLGG